MSCKDIFVGNLVPVNHRIRRQVLASGWWMQYLHFSHVDAIPCPCQKRNGQTLKKIYKILFTKRGSQVFIPKKKQEDHQSGYWWLVLHGISRHRDARTVLSDEKEPAYSNSRNNEL